MIKTITKCVLAVSLAAAAMSVSVSPSFAAKKKAAAKAAACTAPAWASTNCANGVCNVAWCGTDGKWYPSPGFCWEPFCWAPKM
jgi:hypothetical protein